MQPERTRHRTEALGTELRTKHRMSLSFTAPTHSPSKRRNKTAISQNITPQGRTNQPRGRSLPLPHPPGGSARSQGRGCASRRGCQPALPRAARRSERPHRSHRQAPAPPPRPPGSPQPRTHTAAAAPCRRLAPPPAALWPRAAGFARLRPLAKAWRAPAPSLIPSCPR